MSICSFGINGKSINFITFVFYFKNAIFRVKLINLYHNEMKSILYEQINDVSVKYFDIMYNNVSI
ncbi:hypothetical protein B4109_1185 [Geobacillus stearothermophilus]|uniref:Uncharacterized protein n=1 Tax=Geobacillus stearothermophilus TaxID=1422 RepID=A0A150MZE3_GEOSE|nr:hypothetical protein B4109_1185 [Geobacillus stearothermophilus]